MTKSINRLIVLCSAVATIMLSGCGSSNSGAVPSGITVSGVAATGAPIAAAPVRLKDSATPAHELTAPTASDGTYSFNVAGLTAPFIIRVDWTSGGVAQSLLSFATDHGTANITPLSQVIVANAAGAADPTTLYDNLTPAAMQQLAGALAASTAALKNQLMPLFTLYGVTADPITGTFVANHTGMDALLDAVTVTTTNGTLMIANRTTNAGIFTAPMNNFMAGTMNQANMPSISQVPTPVPTPAPTPTPTPTPTPIDGATLYASDCAGCHGQLATSGKRGTTIARVQAAISGNVGGMGSLSTLSATDIQAIVTALSATTTPASAPAPTPTPTPTPTPVDGATLYANSCAGCHGPLTSTSKPARSAVQIQTAITNNTGGMGSLSSLTSTQVSAIAAALATVTPAPTTTTPPACGSCHAIPSATGHHSTHSGRSCATCHGTGYSTTAVNAVSHNNGVKNVVSTIGWNATTRTCANSCHGTKVW